MKESMMAICVAGMVIAYVLWECMQKRKKRQMRRERRNREFGCNPLELPRMVQCRDRLDEIAIYYEETKDELPLQSVDEVTWNDLEMDEVFLRINHTRSYIGEQVLYRRLHAVGMRDDAGQNDVRRNDAEQNDVKKNDARRNDTGQKGFRQIDKSAQ